ncbi:MAG: hypothetical protein KME59_23765 [Trichormus sp. ATA11-4-KO1]|nr:hypothetical protein [Trichormus sp. ATA11-4-KO1]
MKAPVSMWILAAKTDVPYMLRTIPHLVRACNYPFVERVLAIDTANLTGSMRVRYNPGSQEELESACKTLVDQGFIDKIVKIDYEPAQINRIYQKYFGDQQAQQMLNHTHNWKGSTIYGSLYCIEASATDYYLHFDADMLLHQDPDYNWITNAIDLMVSTPSIVTARPLCGPPHPEGKAFQPRQFVKDPRGFSAQKFFSMRAYLINRQTFSLLSPIPLIWKSPPLLSRKLPQPLQPLFAKIERRLRRTSGSIQGALASFEVMASEKLQNSSFVRADLSSTKAWTIHPRQHDPEFIQALPNLIKLIEEGEYPLAQAGHYDLQLEAWLELLKSPV